MSSLADFFLTQRIEWDYIYDKWLIIVNTVCINPTTYLLLWSPGKVSGNLRHPNWNLRRFLKYSGFWSKKLPFKVISLIPYNHKIIGLPFSSHFILNPKRSKVLHQNEYCPSKWWLGSLCNSSVGNICEITQRQLWNNPRKSFLSIYACICGLVLFGLGVRGHDFPEVFTQNIGTQFIKRTSNGTCL